jgi:hypothetical protein
MADDAKIAALEKKIEELAHRVGVLEDIHAIRRVQHAYGYYMDKCLYGEIVDLFADDGEVHFLGGIFKGKAGVRRLYIDRFRRNFTGGTDGPMYGFLLDHPQMQDVVDVAPDRKTAKGRFRCVMQAGLHESAKAPAGQTVTLPKQWWEGGVYENEYAREDGVWKIKSLNYRLVWNADYETGWAHTRPRYLAFFTETYPEDPGGPDVIEDNKPVLWPETEVLAYHYPNPVTGKPWKK